MIEKLLEKVCCKEKNNTKQPVIQELLEFKIE